MNSFILAGTLFLLASTSQAAPINTSICNGKLSVARDVEPHAENIKLFACKQDGGLDSDLNRSFCMAYTMAPKLEGSSTVRDFLGRIKRRVSLFNVTPLYERHAFYAGEVNAITEVEFIGRGYQRPGQTNVKFQGGAYDYTEFENPSRDGYIGRTRAVIAKMNLSEGTIEAEQKIIFENGKQVPSLFQKTLENRAYSCVPVK
jgi:hypothetical protein